MRQKKYTSTEAGLEYRKVNRENEKKMKAIKENWTAEQCKNIEKGMKSGNSNAATTHSRPSQRPSSIRQQSSKTAVETS